MKIYNLKDPMYDFKINLISGCNYEEFREFVEDRDNFSCGIYTNKTTGMYVPIPSRDVYYLFISNTRDTPLIMHEILHMVFDLLDSKGIQLCKESEEAYTYCFEFWVKTILSKLTTK